MVDVVQVRYDLDPWRVNTDLHLERGRSACLPEAEQDWTRSRDDDPRAAPGQLRMRRLVKAPCDADAVGTILPEFSLERSVKRIEREVSGRPARSSHQVM